MASKAVRGKVDTHGFKAYKWPKTKTKKNPQKSIVSVEGEQSEVSSCVERNISVHMCSSASIRGSAK